MTRYNARPLAERFAEKWMPEPNSGCHLWIGAMVGEYGVVAVNRRSTRAHRVAWEMANGPIPDGLQIDHLCRTPACVKPVTQRENVLRGVGMTAQAARRTQCRHGHDLVAWHGGGRRKRFCPICTRARHRESARRRRRSC